MTDVTELPDMPAGRARPAGAALPRPLTRAEKAAVVLGILGPDAAGPIIEQMTEGTLRNFAVAMAKLGRIEPEIVEATIREFVDELERMDRMVNGSARQAREVLQDYVAEATLTRIMEDVESPSAEDVWRKLITVDEGALADFLLQEHPQTAAVVLSKLPAEAAAKILSRLDEESARGIVLGLTKAASLDKSVIDAIGQSVSADFLANYRGGTESFKPAQRIGTIMNFTAGDIRQAVLRYLNEADRDLADAVKSSMFTFQDIPTRIERRDVAAIVRLIDEDTLLKALKGAEDNAAESFDFILGGISSRVAEQLRESLAEMGSVKIREAEEAQNAFLKTIRDLEANGDLKLIAIDE